jgi:hypothetical protein
MLMRVFAKIAGVAAVACTLALGGCSGFVFEPPVYVAVTISPRPVFVPAGGTVVLTGATTNDLGTMQWSVLDSTFAAGGAGTLTAVSGSPNAILYTAPATPPIYSSAAGPAFTEGWVTVDVSVAPPQGTTLTAAKDEVDFVITAPSVTVNLSPATATVALSGTQLFTGYAVGNLNNAVTWQVNGLTGGSTATGTITSTGLYTAPANLPVTGNTVVITVTSQADSTKSASAVVTLS